MQNPNWIRTTIASALLAILLRIGFGVPILTGFVALGIIFLAQIIATEMRPGLDTVRGWLKFVGNAILGIVAFLTLRLIATSFLGLPLAGTYQKLEDSGGLYWTLFGADVPNVILWEILFAILAGGLVVAWVRGRGGKLVRTIFVLAFLVVTLQAWRPMTAAAIQGRVPTDQETATFLKQASLSSILSAFRGSADYPVCDDTADGLRLTLSQREYKLRLHPDCESGWVSMPAEAYSFRILNQKPMEIWFWDGTHRMIHPEDKAWLGNLRNGNLRLRGDEAVTIIVEPR